MDIKAIKRLYNAIFDGVRKPTKAEKIKMDLYVKQYDTFWYYFKNLKYVIVAWEECQKRSITKLSNARWKLTSPSERFLTSMIPDIYIRAVAQLCDSLGAGMGLVFNEKTYGYEKPKVAKEKKTCKLSGKIKYEEKFLI
jgi:hypothetical protein